MTGQRTIATIDELRELPDGSVVRESTTASQFVFWNAGDDIWCIPCDETSYSSKEIHLPVRVLDYGRGV